jgi:hypothetical protein
MLREAREVDVHDARMRAQPFGKLGRIRFGSIQSYGERSKPSQGEESVEGLGIPPSVLRRCSSAYVSAWSVDTTRRAGDRCDRR